MALAGVAIASAVQNEADPPPAKPLAAAIHDALAAEPVSGITARIELKNDLIDAGGFEGVSPLITGGDGRLWWADDGRFRLELQGVSGDVQVVADRTQFWLYDGQSNTVYKGTIPPDEADGAKQKREHRVPTVAQIERKLRKIADHVGIAGPESTVEAGRGAYSIKVSPKKNGGLVGAVGFAWDAVTGTALRAGIYPKGSDTPVVELKATEIEYGDVDSDAFGIEPPANAEVVDVTPEEGATKHKGGDAHKKHDKPEPPDLNKLKTQVGFELTAPTTLAGRPLTGGHAVETERGNAVVLVYGKGLDAIWIVQRPYAAAPAGKAKTDDDFGHPDEQFALPTTEVGGAKATVLETPLGSGLQWSKNGITYAVAGSVPRDTAEAAARSLVTP
jgi:outer membrane lipoprotein-sorting protein